jgi:hypothetical protein
MNAVVILFDLYFDSRNISYLLVLLTILQIKEVRNLDTLQNL